MIIYRIYTIDPDGHVANIEVAECADDKEVVEKVLAQANGRRRHQLVRPSLCRRRPLVLQSLVHHGSWRARRSVDGKLCREKLWRAARGWLSHYGATDICGDAVWRGAIPGLQHAGL